MPNREEMRSLAQEIIGSYEARAAGIASLREEVSDQRQAAQAQLRESHRAHQAIARKQRADLANGRNDLREGETRRKSGVNTWMQGVVKAHQAMAQKQRANLAKGCADLKHDVGTMLQGLDQAHAAMSKEMKADLAKGVANLKRDVDNMLRAFDAALKKVRTALARGRDEWQKMMVTLQAKRRAPGVTVSSPSVAEATPNSAHLRQRVLDHLANHPEGTRMAELEQKFGLSRLQMARVLRNLMNQNKVEKRALEYFAR